MSEKKIVAALCQQLEITKTLIMITVGKGISREQAVFQQKEGQSHIAWLLGHIAWGFDNFTGTGIDRESTLPTEYAKLYSMGTRPTAEPERYPPVEELLGVVGSIIDEIKCALEDVDDEKLAQPLPETSPVAGVFKTVGGLVGAGNFHAAYHAGQAALLRRAQGLPSGMGI